MKGKEILSQLLRNVAPKVAGVGILGYGAKKLSSVAGNIAGGGSFDSE